MLNKSASLSTQNHMLHHLVALDLVVEKQVDLVVKTQACAVWLFSTLLLSSKGKFHADSSARQTRVLYYMPFPESKRAKYYFDHHRCGRSACTASAEFSY